ncbi:unnamed protein product [Prunus armeniaca]|uniref:Zinc finger GRF-type domain-containing protein n=1 Tax=Prunus armeniaca TaxID=36596 RepID=A0A6J5WA35_PRUAR|nr:unnamed protein product [Prunus armeniaca]
MVCWCGKNARIRTSWTISNLGRRFAVCVKGRGGCDLWVWYGVEMCERSKVVIPWLLKSRDKLEISLAKARCREKVLWATLVVLWMLIAMFFFGGNSESYGLKLKTLDLA